MTYFLGLDIGTSAVKAVLVDERGRVKGGAAVAHPLSTPQPGWAEQKPEDWWKSAVKAIRGLLASTRGAAKRIASVGISGQMHSSVFLDQSGKVIRPALLWNDGRTSDECREITALLGERQLREWVQNPALEGFTLPKVLWLRKHEPAAFARLAKVILAKDYVRYRLTGALASEPSDASATLMYDVARRQWSSEIMNALHFSTDLLVDVGGSAEILGRLSQEGARATGLAQGTPVVGGGADNACGAIGVGIVAPGEAVASWGTSGTVLTPTTEPFVDPEMRVHTFCHAVPDTWYLMGAMLSAGAAFAWYRRELARDLAASKNANLVLNKEANRIPPGAGGITFLPYLQGERTPHRDASARGAFVGLSLSHTRAHLSRAVVEGICFALRDSLTILRDLGVGIDQVLVTGGGAQSPFVRQLQADVYGLPVVRVNREEGPAYGAALLAAVGVEAFTDVAAACSATLQRLAADDCDDEAHRAYAVPYQRFRALYPALKSMMPA
ncbi:MAG TPA: xylulokinase [Polyangiaceae bacterium]|nr:xylulokinase [Polyangiaceae bacterium]